LSKKYFTPGSINKGLEEFSLRFIDILFLSRLFILIFYHLFFTISNL